MAKEYLFPCEGNLILQSKDEIFTDHMLTAMLPEEISAIVVDDVDKRAKHDRKRKRAEGVRAVAAAAAVDVDAADF